MTQGGGTPEVMMDINHAADRRDAGAARHAHQTIPIPAAQSISICRRATAAADRQAGNPEDRYRRLQVIYFNGDVVPDRADVETGSRPPTAVQPELHLRPDKSVSTISSPW
jgi:hypothetical protein